MLRLMVAGGSGLRAVGTPAGGPLREARLPFSRAVSMEEHCARRGRP
jgi:hypothetical protein